MSETAYVGPIKDQPVEQQPPFGDQAHEQSAEQEVPDHQPPSPLEGGFDSKQAQFDGQAPSEVPEQLPGEASSQAARADSTWEVAAAQKAAYGAWLERRGIDPGPKTTPHLTMKHREFVLFRNVGLGGGDATSRHVSRTKEDYGVPPDAQYASVDIVPNDANQPHTTRLVVVQEEDFGTGVDEEQIKSGDMDLNDIPRISMKEREFGLFRITGIKGGAASIEYASDLYDIPRDDQYVTRYALIDIESDDPGQPNNPLLVDVTEADFGTVIGREMIDKDFEQPDSGPDSSPMPESPVGAVKTVDIANTLVGSRQGLKSFAQDLMEGRTTDPFSTQNGDVRVRAGGLMPGQQDAYVWTVAPFANAVALTLNNPSRYDAVCVVRGQEREAANGKVGMAQIINPQEVLKIEGENLERLQSIYRDMYSQPDFALTELQRRERDGLFNGYVKSLISEQARLNSEREQIRRRRQQQQPRLREREIPRP